MAEAALEKDVQDLKQDMAVIKHILSEEGKLKPSAKKALKEARATPDAEYVSQDELKKRVRTR
ncbi:hypothetical protein CMO91_04690 [Candidatus Woesearchaeota archaeon]|nr:hypothetical protein [Candidatus Woesearchaeota archaeon]|tara:strand:+ start:217 stop:405 length:189 start_codon:yes stop_codon:yes gene_type:complete